MATEQSVLKEFKTVKQQVEHLLEFYPPTRSNDFYLQVLYLKMFGGLKIPWLDWRDIQKFSGRLETVRRTRQKIQNEDGRWKADDATRSERRHREKIIRKTLPKV